MLCLVSGQQPRRQRSNSDSSRAIPNFPSSPSPLVGSLSFKYAFCYHGTMWPTPGIRYVPLLPSSDRSPRPGPIKHTLVRRGNILLKSKALIVLAIFAVVIVVVWAARTFDFKVAVASKRPVVVSPEVSPGGSISSATSTATEHSVDASLPHTPTYVPAAKFFKEHLSMDEIKAMVSQTRGFYTRDYSLGIGWNNACPLI